MKKLLLLGLIFSSYQSIAQKGLQPAESGNLPTRTNATLINAQEKTLLCVDTLRYPQLKEQILGTNNFPSFSLWKADDESVSQAFLNTGAISISGIEFFGMMTAGGAASVTVEAAIYNVDVNNNPTTLVASGTSTFSSTTAGYRYVSFTPVSVSGNYAVVLKPTNTNGRFSAVLNNPAIGQSYDENFARYKSSYYPQSAGNFVSILTLTNDPVNFTTGQYDFEPIVAPIVSYSINTDFTAVSSPSCLGTPVAYTNTTTPAYVFTNRMLDYQQFKAHFQGAPDSTFAYLMDATTEVWQANHNYTYATAGTFNPTLYTLGGFWNSCTDTKSKPVIVSPLDNAGFAFSATTLCSGAGSEIPTVNLAGGTFTSSPAGLVINASTGEVNLATSAENTYSVTYTTAGTCPNTSIATLTLTSAPNASFTFAQSAFCSAATDPIPALGGGASSGVFSSTTGLVINSSTGVVDLSASSPGTYTVTNTIAASGACPAAVGTYDITVDLTPTATVSGSGQLCGTGTIPVSIALTGSGPWDVSYSDGSTTINVNGQTTSPLVINTTANGTYTVSSVTVGACSSAGVGSATVTFNANPTVALTALANMCVNNTAVTLTGGTPASGTYSGTGVTAGSFNPVTAGVGTHVITYTFTDGNGCFGTATQSIIVDACAGIDELADLNISVSPNPGNDLVTIKFNGSNDLTYSMISEDGKIVINSKVITPGVSEVFSVKSFAHGMYFIHLSNENGTTIKKMIVQ